MEAEIGNAAGAIWQYLSEHGQASLSKLGRATKIPDQPLLMAVGWLAEKGSWNSPRKSEL